MEMSKILAAAADRYGHCTTLGLTTANDGDSREASTCEDDGGVTVAGCGRGEKTTTGAKKRVRRRRRSLASRNLDEMELQMLRQKINGRERQRMHDLNSALDGLRELSLIHI